MEGNNEGTQNTTRPNPESTDAPPPNNSSMPPHLSGVARKTDPAWEFVTLTKEGKVSVFTCLLCGSSYKGGGINRLKQHLAGVTGQVASCKKVSHDIRARMKESLEGGSKKNLIHKDNVVEANVAKKSEEPNASKRKATEGGGIGKYFASRTNPGDQPSLRSAWASQEAQHNAKMSFARWAYVNCIPFNAMTCPLFQQAIDAAVAIGSGFKVPSYHEYRVSLLSDCKKECQLLIDSHRAKWKENGCTLMADGWTDVRQRTLINFLVYSVHGIIFVKSIDASDVVKDAHTLFSMFKEVIEWIGPENVVHVVTDNAANYVACGRLIKERYKTIYWSPCAAHCLNLVLKDIAYLPHVSDLAKKASKITIFAYNHLVFLSWLRKRPKWKEIVRPGVTRFATTFITLHSMYEHKHDLQALVVDQFFDQHKLAKTEAGKTFRDIILDNRFWGDCFEVVRVVSPLIRLLRIVDSDQKPSMPYVYEGMQRAKNVIKEMFDKKKDKYMPYTNIIRSRWDKHLKNELHAAAYLLNPAFLYSPDFVRKHRCLEAIIDLFEATSPNEADYYVTIMKQISIYRDRKESFAKVSCEQTAKKLVPHDWWLYYGGSIPQLQKIAIRVLSQTSSSSGCERNWSLFERIHSKRRNRLEHQRLDDLVFANYNLRLKFRDQLKKKKDNYDPIDYESIDKVDFWVLEEETTPEFDDVEATNVQLEQMARDFGDIGDDDDDDHIAPNVIGASSLNVDDDDVTPSGSTFPPTDPPPSVSIPRDFNLNDINDDFFGDDY